MRDGTAEVIGLFSDYSNLTNACTLSSAATTPTSTGSTTPATCSCGTWRRWTPLRGATGMPIQPMVGFKYQFG